MKSNPKELEGVLHFWSETGTEGGYWAFQDKNFITPNTTYFVCTKCGKPWDKEKNPNGLPHKQTESLVVDRLITLDKIVDELEKGIEPNFPTECPPNKHDFQPFSKELWSYDGLHVLEDGDILTIYSKGDRTKIVWTGTIKLKQHPLFKKHAQGMWIHADQKGISRKIWAKWFFEGYPAKLIKANKPQK